MPAATELLEVPTLVVLPLLVVPPEPVVPPMPAATVAKGLSVTVLPTGKDLEHPLDPVQSIPAGLEVTLPWPPTVTGTVSG
jgi:hypothetical protein